MGLLDVHSLISLSRVCRRFHHLHGDEFIWSDVDLSEVSVRAKLDVRKLKKIVSTYLPQSLWRVKLSSNTGSKNPPIVTESLLNELFTKCPSVTTIVLHKCDLTIVRYHLLYKHMHTHACSFDLLHVLTNISSAPRILIVYIIV